MTGEFNCGRPPVPWKCSREHGHQGSCAVTHDPNVSEKATLVVIKNHTSPAPAFYLSKEQLDAAKEWMNKHDNERRIQVGNKIRYSGAIGGAYTWCFTATSLGTVSILKCSCGEKLDVSDYDAW